MPNYPVHTQRIVEDGLKTYFPGDLYPKELRDPMQYSLFAGGKRFRGILVIESARVFGADPSVVLPSACAVEYIHTYSLIHDDLPAIDNDELRRGKPTCHIVYGEDMAILAGDALNTEAFNLISTHQQADDPQRIVHAIRELAGAAGAEGMVAGQVVDIVSEGKPVDLETLAYIHEKKTGALIMASARIGGILAGAPDDQLELLGRYAAALGLAFQITDDILDVVGSTEVLGKTAGSDERKKKATFPELYGLEDAKLMAAEMITEAKAALKRIDGDTTVLEELADFVYEREF